MLVQSMVQITTPHTIPKGDTLHTVAPIGASIRYHDMGILTLYIARLAALHFEHSVFSLLLFRNLQILECFNFSRNCI